MIDSEKKSRNLQLSLTGLCVVFVLIIVIEMNQEYELSIDRRSAKQVIEINRVATIASENVATKSLDDYEQIIVRPLFMQDRRPYVAEDAVVASRPGRQRKQTAKTAKDDYKLSAVVITDDKRIALLQSGRNDKLQKLNQGDEIDGWILTDIQRAQVSLEKGGEIKLLELAVKNSPVQTNAKQDTKNETKERQSPLSDELEEDDDEGEPSPLNSDEKAESQDK
jgi:hypothetical protein